MSSIKNEMSFRCKENLCFYVFKKNQIINNTKKNINQKTNNNYDYNQKPFENF